MKRLISPTASSSPGTSAFKIELLPTPEVPTNAPRRPCAKNARSALKLGHVRGALLLAAASAGIQIAEYTPTEVKKAVVGFGRAEKHQVRDMVALLLGMTELPSPLDVSDALAVAVCHAHAQGARSLIKAATLSCTPRRAQQQVHIHTQCILSLQTGARDRRVGIHRQCVLPKHGMFVV